MVSGAVGSDSAGHMSRPTCEAGDKLGSLRLAGGPPATLLSTGTGLGAQVQGLEGVGGGLMGLGRNPGCRIPSSGWTVRGVWKSPSLRLTPRGMALPWRVHVGDPVVLSLVPLCPPGILTTCP